MSKAFLRESDYEAAVELPAPAALLPPGAKNYLTEAGAARLKEELIRLTAVERPPLVHQAGDPAAKRELQAIDRRIRYLQESLRTAEVVTPPGEPTDVVRFGATVTVKSHEGDVSTYRLVGVDEAEPEAGAVSWTSPLARALLNGRVGERVRFRAPAGARELQILRIEY